MQRRQYVLSVLSGLASPHLLAGADATHASRRLEKIVQMIAQGRILDAVPLARQLSQDFPAYAPAQVLYADVLALRSGQAAQLWRPDLTQALKSTHAELGLRQRASSCRPKANMLPMHVQNLAAHTRKMLVIDTAKARLYALEHDHQQVRVVADYYVSVGRLGVDKRLEGDEKTPHGIYAVTRRLKKEQLRDTFFGAGALPINYPNPFDKRMERTGSGIWFHGSPAGEPSRALFSSNGCIVLADSDMQELLDWTQPYTTPVVIASNIQWRPIKPGLNQPADKQTSRLVWQEGVHQLQVRFDSARQHRFERDMVQYELMQAGQLRAMDRQGQWRLPAY